MRLLPITLAFTLSSAYAVQGTGEYFYGPDMAENIACQIAEDHARTDAIRNFLGEEFESSTNEVCYNVECYSTQDTNSSVMGVIKKVNKKEILTSVEQGKKVCTVEIDATVERISNDIYFNTWTEQPVFRHGEEVKYFAVTNKPGYLYVFNYHSKKYHKVLSKKIVDVQNEFPILDKNQKLIAQVPDGMKVSKEKMVFIFTELDKQPKSVYNDVEMDQFIRSLPIAGKRIINRVVQIVR
jgi:hypothetical protein